MDASSVWDCLFSSCVQVGFYGIDRGDEVCDENTGAGSTFVAETSIELEREAAAAAPRNSTVFKEFASPAADFDSEEEKEKEETDSEKKSGFAGCRVVFLRYLEILNFPVHSVFS